jgi:hypothetical protein
LPLDRLHELFEEGHIGSVARFQKRVLLSALKLLEELSGPVITDFPEDLPVTIDKLPVTRLGPNSPGTYPKLTVFIAI